MEIVSFREKLGIHVHECLKLKIIRKLDCFSAQQFGEQMQQSNPELFDQLRGQAQAAVNQHREQNQSREGQDPQPGEKSTGHCNIVASKVKKK